MGIPAPEPFDVQYIQETRLLHSSLANTNSALLGGESGRAGPASTATNVTITKNFLIPPQCVNAYMA